MANKSTFQTSTSATPSGRLASSSLSSSAPAPSPMPVTASAPAPSPVPVASSAPASSSSSLPTTAAVGVDIVPIARMAQALRRTPSLKQALFTQEEIAYCEARPHPEQSYAARFAAREATLKALGVGFYQMGLHNLHDISVGIDEKGRPFVLLHGRVQEIAQAAGVSDVAISLSHTQEVAIANAVALTQAIRPKTKDEPSLAEEMLHDFKTARPILDELDAQLDAQFGKM